MGPGDSFCVSLSRLAQRGTELANDKELQEAIHFLNRLGRVDELCAEDLDAVVEAFRAEGQGGQSAVMQAILSGLRTSTIINKLVGPPAGGSSATRRMSAAARRANN